MITKEEIRQKIKDVSDGTMKQSDFLLFCVENETAVLNACDSRTERFVVKNAIKTYRLFHKKK